MFYILGLLRHASLLVNAGTTVNYSHTCINSYLEVVKGLDIAIEV